MIPSTFRTCSSPSISSNILVLPTRPSQNPTQSMLPTFILCIHYHDISLHLGSSQTVTFTMLFITTGWLWGIGCESLYDGGFPPRGVWRTRGCCQNHTPSSARLSPIILIVVTQTANRKATPKTIPTSCKSCFLQLSKTMVRVWWIWSILSLEDEVEVEVGRFEMADPMRRINRGFFTIDDYWCNWNC
jgi:hypothetical protein